MNSLASNQSPATVAFAFQRGVRGELEHGRPAPWSEFVAFVRTLVGITTPCADITNTTLVDAAKESMPAIVPARFDPDETRRLKTNVRGTRIIGCDIDKAPPEAVAAAIIKCMCMSILVHGSPTDGLDPTIRKIRIYALADRELAPEEIWPARCALAERLGLRPWLDEATKDGGARIFFAGHIQGTPPRDFCVGDGPAVPVDALLAAYPLPSAAPPLPAATDETSGVHEVPRPWSLNVEQQMARVPAIVDAFNPAYIEGGRHRKIRALAGELGRRGFDDGPIEAVARGLSSDKPDARVEQALDAAKLARAGERVFSFREAGLSEAHRTALLSMITDPRVPALESATPEPAPAAPKHAAPEVLTVASVYAKITPVDWVCEFLRLAAGAPTIIAGYGGAGKTLLVQVLVVCIVTGTPFFGHPVKQGRVRHYDYEQGARITLSRYQRIAAAMGLPDEALADGLDIVCGPDFKLTTPGARERLVRECEGYTLAVFDSLRASTEGEENDSRIREPLDMLFGVSEATRCAMLVIHHARKASKTNGAGGNQDMRGNSAINDACQTVIMLKPNKTKDGFEVECGKVREGRDFKPFEVEITDPPVTHDGFNVPGLRLVLADGAAKEAGTAQAEQASDDAAVMTYLEKQPAGRFEGGCKELWLALDGKLGRNRVEAAVGRLTRARRVTEQGYGKSRALVVTPGTSGVEVGPDGVPRVAR